MEGGWVVAFWKIRIIINKYVAPFSRSFHADLKIFSVRITDLTSSELLSQWQLMLNQCSTGVFKTVFLDKECYLSKSFGHQIKSPNARLNKIWQVSLLQDFPEPWICKFVLNHLERDRLLLPKLSDPLLHRCMLGSTAFSKTAGVAPRRSSGSRHVPSSPWWGGLSQVSDAACVAHGVGFGVWAHLGWRLERGH